MNTVLTTAFLVFVFSIPANARMTTKTIVERGVLSLGLLAGGSESRVLNSDGSLSSFRGYSYGFEPDIKIASFDESELHLFGRHLIQSLDSKFGSDKVNTTHSLLGLKAFLGSHFYLGAGYGPYETEFKTPTIKYSIKNLGPALGIGAEFNMATNYFLGFHFWYSNAALKYEAPLSSNSFIESGALFISFVWSPPTAIVNIKQER